jgi:dTDP-4-amino-4,6-dideoxygalactose transaminase
VREQGKFRQEGVELTNAVKVRCGNLRLLHEQLADEIAVAVIRVLNSGWYVLGPEVDAFERAFADYHNVGFAVGVANGTDAIELALRAGGVGPGDEVITVAHTAVATVCAIERTGATPVLVDINPVDFTMDPDACRAAVTSRTKAIVPVHLYGHPANLGVLSAIAERHGLLLIEDCAQAHGAKYDGRLVGTFGQMSAFSFYPTKNLGAYGDGGAVITDDPQLAAKLKRLRFYGQAERYQAVERGINSRLDEMQAAILSVKLKYLDTHNQARRAIANFYDRSLSGVELPRLRQSGDGSAAASIHHVYHQYVIRHARRNELGTALRDAGVETQIHYPIPVHRQPAYADLRYPKGSLPVTERIADQILSLPICVGLTTSDLAIVADAIATFTEKEGCHNAA